MTYIIKQQRLIITTTAFAFLLVIPGCGEKTSKNRMSENSTAENTALGNSGLFVNDGTRAIVTMDGNPIVTQGKIDKTKDDLIAAQPELKAMISAMPQDKLNRQISDDLTRQIIIARYIEDSGISKTADYQKKLEGAIQQIKQMLNVRTFFESLQVSVSDADARNYYEQNKNQMPQLIINRGGVVAKGISFEQESDAQAFVAKMNTLNGNIEQTAKDMNMTDKVQDFKTVNELSVGIDPQLRDKIVAIKTVPTTELIKINNSFWVVRATKKEDAQYQNFDTIKNDIKAYLVNQERTKLFQAEVDRLKKEYNIQVDDSFFGNESEDKELPMMDMEELPEDMEDVEQEAKSSASA